MNDFIHYKGRVSFTFDVVNFYSKQENMKNIVRRNAGRYLLSVMLALASCGLYAQGLVSGLVTDSQQEPLPGVTVLVKGASAGSITDMDGKYSIQITDPQAILTFSYVGYATQEIRVAGKSIVNVTLEEEGYELDEFVAIGYGSVKKSDLTASVASVDMQDLLKAPVASFDQALAGRVAGVQVTQGDGQPGSAANIVIRGGNSITQDNSPLYVIDGFPIENPDNSVLDPSVIESIDVLKDASATAIYGARGANGVIIITTKKGQEGPPRITFEGYYGVQSKPRNIDVLGAYDFVALMYELDPTKTTNTYFADGTTMNYYRTAPAINWQDEVFRSGFEAPVQNYSLNLNGGTQNTKYTAGLSYNDQDGIIVNSNYNIWRFRGTLDQQINKRLKIGTSVNYSESRANGSSPSQGAGAYSSSQYLLWSVWAYRPVAQPGVDLMNEMYDYDVDMANDYRFNPVKTIQNEYKLVTSQQLNLNGSINYNIMKDFDFRTIFTYLRRTDKTESFNNSQTYWGDPNYQADKMNGSVYFREWANWTNENTLTYKTRINNAHNINAMGGFSLARQNTYYFGAKSVLVPWESLGIQGLDDGVPKSITSSGTHNTMMSFFGRLNYDYQSRYLVTATMRSDGSSRFPKNNKWGYFPSFALAWRMTEEDFMKRLDLGWLSNVKWRAGWGATGNNRTASDYNGRQFLSSVDYSFNNAPQNGLYVSTLSSQDLKWETTYQTNIGLDLGLANNRINLIADIYRKDTKDLLFNANIPPSSGFTTAMQNIGEIRNEGLELSLNTVNLEGKRGKMKWTTAFNIAFNKNKVMALSGDAETFTQSIYWDTNWRNTTAYIAKVGQPISLMYGYVFDGVYQHEDFENGILKADVVAKLNGATPQPGDMKLKDMNGDGLVDANDRTVIGRGLPIHTGGFTNNFEYKNFDLNVFFQWSYGNDVLNANRIKLETANKYNTNQFALVADRWREAVYDGDGNMLLAANYSNDQWRVFGANGQDDIYISKYVEDASYLRLKTVQLGYNIPKKKLEKAGIHSLRVYLSGQNLYTWTGYSGFDPEVSVRNTALTQGFDYSAYPRTRTFALGCKLIF